MAEIASSTARVLGTTAQPRGMAAQPAMSVEVALLQAPAKLSAVARTVEASGLLEAMPTAARITLATALGTLELALSRMTTEREVEILQTLASMRERRAALTLVITPEQAPRTGVKASILIPNSSAGLPSSQPSEHTTTKETIVSGKMVLGSSLAEQPISGEVHASIIRAIILPTNARPPDHLPLLSLSTTPEHPEPPLASQINNDGLPKLLPTPLLTSAASLASQYQSYDKAMRNALSALQEVHTIDAQHARREPPQTTSTLPTIQQSSLTPKLPGPIPPLTAPQEVLSRLSPAIPSQPNQQTRFPESQAATGSLEYIATLESRGADGHAILKSSDANFFIPAATPLVKAPLGSQGMVGLTAPHVLQGTEVTQTNVEQQNPETWPQLLDSVSNLGGFGAATSSLPRLPIVASDATHLGSSLLFFLSALKGNDWHAWLKEGGAQRLAQAGQTRLIGKLEEFLRKAVRDEESSDGDSWRTYALPILDQDMPTTPIGYPVLCVRRDREGSGNGEKENAANQRQRNTRFLIDMRLSKLGAIQLDGLISQKKMDLILRSERPLPQSTQGELKTLYEKTLGSIEYAGLLQFQTERSRWVVFKKSPTTERMTA